MTLREEHIVDRLLLYLENELSPIESEKIRLHLRDCQGCRASADETRELLKLLTIDDSDAPLLPAWPQVEERLRKTESRRMSLVAGFAVAAGLLIALLIGHRTELSERNVWSPSVFAFSSERDTAVVEFVQSTPTKKGF